MPRSDNLATCSVPRVVEHYQLAETRATWFDGAETSLGMNVVVPPHGLK